MRNAESSRYQLSKDFGRRQDRTSTQGPPSPYPGVLLWRWVEGPILVRSAFRYATRNSDRSDLLRHPNGDVIIARLAKYRTAPQPPEVRPACECRTAPQPPEVRPACEGWEPSHSRLPRMNDERILVVLGVSNSIRIALGDATRR
jgi:hypothetical protein